ncbi:carbonic anhydrase [Pseudooceanicola nitratireducens]|uniref:Carbonic anhydrase n=1 Tax=Pseudooceanicola nitratireducens TaxID=517719 RepID=A0A1I1IA41_9RHOB|nr:carbonic anhydrase [Pseudooceanicola nitratireducens]MEC7298091.1 carbonic anhydrase [Pseudomonadota bacterium]MBY6157697.1 carbonic anhydrase [Pseudooceanicola nitratireducens]MBY6164490.1 carbonic anhydrase [Pseudooceanicola nitratireducens]MEC7791990.1 carbonic anhydrase [Pseudomonadota bacterium]MEC7793325.1 carbonic anhydrase [Pseudomonadota bacterium]|eukprot:g16952.t1
MKLAKPLPAYLVQRFHGWKATTFSENKAWYRRLADEGQRPRAMVISCCDSRVHVTAIFGADQGEFFIHRNIANLVPPYEPDGNQHGTSAAIEYAVTALKVAHIVIVGHSNCGGVKGCLDMCSGHAPELEEKTSFVGRWMDLLRPGYERIKDIEGETERARALEKQAILVSLDNLMTFPYVEEAVKSGKLSLHGLWNDIGDGGLEQFMPETGTFQAV